LRVPSRFAALVILGLAPLAGEGLASLLAATKGSEIRRDLRKYLTPLVGGACLAVLMVERADRLPSQKGPSGESVPAVYRWLEGQPKPSPMVELPIATDAFQESPRSYYSTYHNQPLVNGSRSFLPPGYEILTRLLSTFPSPAAIST